MRRLTLTLAILMVLAMLLPVPCARGAAAAVEETASLLSNWVTYGSTDGDLYGISVASDGDINNDGYADVVVGSENYVIGGNKPGAAFVFLGGPGGLAAAPHLMLTNAVHGSNFGHSVSYAGDVNNDGFDDVIIGANHFHATTGWDGAAYLYLGSASGLSETPAWSRIGLSGEDEFGTSVAGAGDVNGDGYDDVLIGAARFADVEDAEGAIYLFYGGASGLSADPVWSYQADNRTAQLGYRVAGVGDLNQDGYADFAAGAPFYDLPALADTGLVVVFYGSATVPGAAPDWFATGDQADSRFGTSVAGAGDVNGNGYPDLLIGARGQDTTLLNCGAAYLFYASASGINAAADWSVFGRQAYSGFGVAVAGMGDFNGDGYGDVVVGAHLFSNDQPQEGAVFVFRGSPSGPVAYAQWVVYGDKAETEFGASISLAGDVNGDGKADLLVGSPSYKIDSKTKKGASFGFFGTELTSVVAIPFITNVILPIP